jgi:hypothetical protein
MPKLLIFAPGEKVIIDKTDNTVSIIGILGGFNVTTLGEENVVPEGAALPLRWSVLALWGMGTNDVGKVFEQRLQLLTPGGEIALDMIAAFKGVPAIVNHRI